MFNPVVLDQIHLKCAFYRTRFTPGIPNRSAVIAATVGATSHIATDISGYISTLLQTTPEPDPFHIESESKLLSEYCNLHQCDYNYIICPNTTHCDKCHQLLSIGSSTKCYVYDDAHIGQFGLPGTMYNKVCFICNRIYHIGMTEYLIGHRHWIRERPQYSDTQRFWRHSRCTIITTATLNRVETQQYHSHSGISTITDEYNNLHNDKSKPKRGFIIDSYSFVIYI